MPATRVPDLPEVLPVKAQCLPYAQIPHTSRLFLDFLSDFSNVQPFYPSSPYSSEWQKPTRRNYEPQRRARRSDILARQTRAWGASEKTIVNIARLRGGASAALTGQQVGLFGGPLFALYKALSAVKLAEQATGAGVDCVPAFWLATNARDRADANHTHF